MSVRSHVPSSHLIPPLHADTDSNLWCTFKSKILRSWCELHASGPCTRKCGMCVRSCMPPTALMPALLAECMWDSLGTSRPESHLPGHRCTTFPRLHIPSTPHAPPPDVVRRPDSSGTTWSMSMGLGCACKPAGSTRGLVGALALLDAAWVSCDASRRVSHVPQGLVGVLALLDATQVSCDTSRCMWHVSERLHKFSNPPLSPGWVRTCSHWWCTSGGRGGLLAWLHLCKVLQPYWLESLW